MDSPIPDYLEQILSNVWDDTDGEVADYIPELAETDPSYLGAALCTTTGHLYSTGDCTVPFSIQSISKPFVYALALEEYGLDKVREIVGMEPSGEAFNELSLNRYDNRPVNPMINAGAIAVTQLINGVDSSVEDRVECIRAYFSQMAGRELRIVESVCESELGSTDRNYSLAHMLRNYDIISDEAHDAVATYVNQCAIEVTTEDLAVMAATLANGGKQPVTREKILSTQVCRQTLAVMSSAGMYDGAGRWMAAVGIPAKSGVSGGLIGCLPGQLGVATYSPRLNEEGNSVRGVRAFELLSNDMGLHLMSTEDRYNVHSIRNVEDTADATVIHLQGVLNFNAAESILYQLADYEWDRRRVVLDVSRVTETNRMGWKMMKEGLRRLREAGKDIAVVDPDDNLTNRTLSDGTEVPVRDEDPAEN
ncbi:glutaminase [Corynebacterium massiliense]|uniref:Glutaminase n=1 Tax=Corynebacterium massiliense DSM 45435 TaxID=1121364 RepID=A0ABY7U8Q7_9CORY|nr:glutaminase [Corynebacterium massiliense]WCZ33083.1 Glutaminase 2 [Corynebacterium massiliense DSM 45435]